METCIAIKMYCQRLFLLFTGKQHCLHKHFFRGSTCNEYLSSRKKFQIGGVTILAVQLFNKIKRKKKKTKNMFRCFLYVLDIDVTRNGNKLNLSFP